MANEAVINFLFNSQGAIRGLDNFKKRFSDVLDGIENSSIGKFTAIGSAIAGAFSIKSFVDYTKTMADFSEMWRSMPIEKVSRFANLMQLMNRKADFKESVSALGALQQRLNDFRENPANRPKLWDVLGINLADSNGRFKTALEIMDELIVKYREYQKNAKEGEKIDDSMVTDLLQSMGLSEPMVVAMKKRMNQSEDDFEAYTEKLGKMFEASAGDYEKIDKFSQSITLLENSFRKFGKTMLENSHVGDIIDGLTNAINKFNELPEDTQKRIFGIAFAFMALGPAIKVLKGIGWLINPWIIFIGLIAAVSNNVGGLKDKLEEFQKKYNDWVQGFKQEHPILGAWFEELGKLIDAVLHPIENLKKAWNDLKDALSIDFKIPDAVKNSFRWFKNKLSFGSDEDKNDESSDSNTASTRFQRPVYVKDFDGGNGGKSVTVSQTNIFNVEGDMTEDVGDGMINSLNGSVMRGIVNQVGGSYSGDRFKK